MVAGIVLSFIRCFKFSSFVSYCAVNCFKLITESQRTKLIYNNPFGFSPTLPKPLFVISEIVDPINISRPINANGISK